MSFLYPPPPGVSTTNEWIHADGVDKISMFGYVNDFYRTGRTQFESDDNIIMNATNDFRKAKNVIFIEWNVWRSGV